MDDDRSPISRRAILGATGGTLALPGVGGARASADAGPVAGGRCPDATTEPSHDPCPGSNLDGCADDHPETVALRDEVAIALEERYPDVGALVDDGFRPYFDALERGEGSWSHWLNPEYIGDDGVVDPERPESVLVDNESWRAMGVMFVATRDSDPIEEPPPVYEVDDQDATSGGRDTAGDGQDSTNADRDGEDVESGRCSPWHSHVGLPGRFAWWYYEHVYEGGESGILSGLPCATPCVMHVWTIPHPEGVYAHDAPPAAERDLEPAATAGFETDAEPGVDELDWDVLPEAVVPDLKPDALWERWV